MTRLSTRGDYTSTGARSPIRQHPAWLRARCASSRTRDSEPSNSTAAVIRPYAMSVVFSAPHHDIVVSQNADASYTWSGQYNGIEIKRAVPIENGKLCILLLDPDASKRSTFENLLCIDRRGRPVWTATLPTSPDAFLDIASTPAGLLAKTWSGLTILLDQRAGTELRRTFVK